MFKVIKNLFSSKKLFFKDYNLPHEALYKKLLIQSYSDWFYKELEIQNDINGRFEIIVLHIFIIFNSLSKEVILTVVDKFLVKPVSPNSK